jgi:hypothetical protein
MINQQIAALGSELSASESASDERIFSLGDQIDALVALNGKRVESAKARFYAASDEGQYQGEQNAGDTIAEMGYSTVTYDERCEVFDSCEFWEIAADSAFLWDDNAGLCVV